MLDGHPRRAGSGVSDVDGWASLIQRRNLPIGGELGLRLPFDRLG